MSKQRFSQQRFLENEQSEHPKSRNLPIISGLTSSCKFLDGQENVFISIGETMRDSGLVFLYEGDVLRIADGKVETLMDASGIKKEAPAILANDMVFSDGNMDFLPPSRLYNTALRNSTVKEMLPRITYLANTPIYDQEFTLLQGPKFHSCGVMVLSQPIYPVTFSVSLANSAIDRLPPLLKRLLGGFCFRSDADVANTLAVLITSVLINHCLDFDRALIIVDGNRSNVGKSFLIRSLGGVTDDNDIPMIAYTANDEELRKHIIARLQRKQYRLLCIDNAKTATGSPVSSAVLESFSSAKTIAGRILGTSTEAVVKNDFLFAITMNCTNVSPDLLSRPLPIRLHYEKGDPRHRKFDNKNPVKFAQKNRNGILAELFGMIDYWIAQGRPLLPFSHRCHEWASLVGSVLYTCGFPEFLSNFDAAAEEFNSQTNELRELFDIVYSKSTADTLPPKPGKVIRTPTKPLPSAEWGDYLRCVRSHAATIGQAKGNTGVGMQARRILGTYLNSDFEFTVSSGTGKAVLRSEQMRGRKTGYFFETVFDAPELSDSSTTDGNALDQTPPESFFEPLRV